MTAQLPRILLVEPQFVLRRTIVMVARDLGMVDFHEASSVGRARTLLVWLARQALADQRRHRHGHDLRHGHGGHDRGLDGIDRDRRYQRGTFAAFRGGLVRSFRATDPLADGELERAGWHTIMRGIDEFAIELGADGRTLGMAVRMSDGAVVTKSVTYHSQ